MTTPYLTGALFCHEVITDGFAIWEMIVKSQKIENTDDVHLLPIISSHRIATLVSDTVYYTRDRFELSFCLSFCQEAQTSDETPESVRFRLEHAFLTDEHCRCLRRRNRRWLVMTPTIHALLKGDGDFLNSAQPAGRWRTSLSLLCRAI